MSNIGEKKKKTSTSFPFPPTSGAMLGVTVEVVGVTTPFVVGCSFAFLLQTVTSSCFVRQRFRDCTEGGVLSTSRFFSPWRVGGLGVGNGGKGYQGIEVVSKSFHPKFLRRFMRSNVRLSRRYFLVGEVGKKKIDELPSLLFGGNHPWAFCHWGPACDTPLVSFGGGEFLGDCPAFLFTRNCFQGDNESWSKIPKEKFPGWIHALQSSRFFRTGLFLGSSQGGICSLPLFGGKFRPLKKVGKPGCHVDDP